MIHIWKFHCIWLELWLKKLIAKIRVTLSVCQYAEYWPIKLVADSGSNYRATECN